MWPVAVESCNQVGIQIYIPIEGGEKIDEILIQLQITQQYRGVFTSVSQLLM